MDGNYPKFANLVIAGSFVKNKEKDLMIKFNTGNDWVMALNKNGQIEFNRSKWPKATPDDFAKAVIEILESQYTVEFKKNGPPYNR